MRQFSLLQLAARNSLNGASTRTPSGEPGNLKVRSFRNSVFLSVSLFTFELLQAAATDSFKPAGCGKSATKRSSSEVRISNWQKLEFKMPALKFLHYSATFRSIKIVSDLTVSRTSSSTCSEDEKGRSWRELPPNCDNFNHSRIRQ